MNSPEAQLALIGPGSVAMPQRPFPVLRWFLLLALLTAEITLLGIRYDTKSVKGLPGFSAEIIRHSPQIVQMGICAIAGMILVGFARLAPALSGAMRVPHHGVSAWVFLLAHLVGFLSFYQLSWRVIEHTLPHASHSGVILWALSGLATIVAWSSLLIRPVAWPSFGVRNLRIILGGAAIGLAAWAAGRYADRLWEPLGQSTLWMVQHLLQLTGQPVAVNPQTFSVGILPFIVQIAPSCSGYEGMGLITVFMAVHLWLCRRELRFPGALALLPLGVGLMWLVNSVRIAALLLVGRYVSPAIATGGFHSQAGWIGFCAVAFGMLALLRHSPLAVKAPRAFLPRVSNPASPFLLPLLATLAASMITGLFTVSGVDYLYPVKVIVGLLVLWHYRGLYTRWSWRPSGWAAQLGVMAFGMWIVLAPDLFAEQSQTRFSPLMNMPPMLAICWWSLKIIGYVFIAPMVEELAFRSYLLRKFRPADAQRSGSQVNWLGLMVSSLVFGAMHGNWWFAGAFTGAIYAVAWYRRGRMVDAFVAHSTTNLLILFYCAATGNWSYWG